MGGMESSSLPPFGLEQRILVSVLPGETIRVKDLESRLAMRQSVGHAVRMLSASRLLTRLRHGLYVLSEEGIAARQELFDTYPSLQLKIAPTHDDEV